MFRYGVKALYVGGASPYSSLFEQLALIPIQNVISTDISLVYPRTDIMGWDGGGNQEQVDRPRAQFSFTYLPVSGYNEGNIGFVVGGLVSALYNLNTERNYYITANNAGVDAFSYTGNNSWVMALGNCAMTRYEFSAAVGQFTSATVTTEALNLLIQTGNSGQILPAITKQTAAAVTGQYQLTPPFQAVGNFTEVNPASILLSFDTGSAFGAVLSGNNACRVQSFRFSIDMPRESVKSVGWAYPDTRSVIWPITISIQADMTLNNLQLDALNRYNCNDSGYNFTVNFKNSCTTNDNYSFIFQGAKLNTQNLVGQIGVSETVALEWTVKINDVNRMSSGNPNFLIGAQLPGVYTGVVFPQILATTGFGPLTIFFGTGCYVNVVKGAAWLSGNIGTQDVSVYYPDFAETATVRAIVSGSTEYQDISTTIF